jgi:predicted Rossmann fold flavoprotein
MRRKRLIVIGGGAAGFFCAVNAAAMDPALEVIIIEKTGKFLSKVKVSGGGRCNVTHSCFSIPDMVKNYPRGERFLKKAFHEFFTKDTVSWFSKRGVELKTEADGRMFPVSDSSETIIDCLVKEMNLHKVQIWLNREVKAIRYTGSEWILNLQEKTEWADYICVACGGYAKLSSFAWLEALGHSAEAPVPSLFTFNLPGNPITALMGVSVERARVKISGSSLQQEGPLLITHWGLSGPAILKTSAWGARELAGVSYRFKALINWLPEFNEHRLRERLLLMRTELGAQKLAGKNPFGLPQRLWEFLCLQSGSGEGTRWADMPAATQNKLIRNLVAYEADANGKTTFKEEFVTAGGIRLNEIDHQTMQSKLQPTLFFAGEIMDVDGVTGGFNFQHAWTSGWIAARSIAAMSKETTVPGGGE